MALTFNDFNTTNSDRWAGQHLNDLLQNQPITDLNNGKTVSLETHGTTGLADMYLDILKELNNADRYGKPSISKTIDSDTSVIKMNPNMPNRFITNPRLLARRQKEYEIPTTAATAIEQDLNTAYDIQHHIHEYLPLTLSDGSVVDMVHVFVEGPDYIESEICAFSDMAPRETFPTKTLDYYEYTEDGTGGQYEIEKFGSAFSSGYVRELNPVNLQQIAEFIESQKQPELLPELQNSEQQHQPTQLQIDYPELM